MKEQGWLRMEKITTDYKLRNQQNRVNFIRCRTVQYPENGSLTSVDPYETPNRDCCYRTLSISKPYKNEFILLSFLQTWTNAIPQLLSVTRVPRVRIPLVLIAAYATGLGLFIEMEKVALVSIARLGQQRAA